MKRFRTTDPIQLKLRRLYNTSRSQARHRSEEWHIQWEDYLALWLEDDNYKQIGIGKHSLNLCRTNTAKAWTLDNVSVQTRSVNCQRKFGERYAT